MPTEDVLEHGQREMIFVGPIEDEKLKQFIIKDHLEFWKL